MKKDTVNIKGGNALTIKYGLITIVGLGVIADIVHNYLTKEEPPNQTNNQIQQAKQNPQNPQNPQEIQQAKQNPQSIQNPQNPQNPQSIQNPQNPQNPQSIQQAKNLIQKMPNLETIHKILQQLHSIQKEKNSVKEKEIDNELFKYINDLIDEYRNKYNVLDEKLTKLETDFDTNKENIKLELEQHKTAALQEKNYQKKTKEQPK